jgi:hypothetical protein
MLGICQHNIVYNQSSNILFYFNSTTCFSLISHASIGAIYQSVACVHFKISASQPFCCFLLFFTFNSFPCFPFLSCWPCTLETLVQTRWSVLTKFFSLGYITVVSYSYTLFTSEKLKWNNFKKSKAILQISIIRCYGKQWLWATIG